MESTATENLKRKLMEELQYSQSKEFDPTSTAIILKRLILLSPTDHVLLKSAIEIFSKLPNITIQIDEDFINILVKNDAIQSVTRLLQLLEEVEKDDSDEVTQFYQHELKIGCATILLIIADANKPEYQQLIIDSGALSCLLDLLKKHKTVPYSPSRLLREVVDAVTRLAQKNHTVKTLVRMEGGIPPLVELLEFNDKMVQSATALALIELVSDDVQNKKKMVEYNALPAVVVMLQSEYIGVQFTGVYLIKTLVDNSPDIEREVLLAGALQPVICLLSSTCSECQRLAAVILGQFLTTDPNLKVHISQRGAIPPLVDMLKLQINTIKRASTYALTNLAQDSHNQASIAHSGGIEALLNLLNSDDLTIQRNAAHILSCLADNEDIVAHIVKVGGYQKLRDGNFVDELMKEYVSAAEIRLEQNMRGRALKYLIHLMRSAEEPVRRCIVLALADLCAPQDHKIVFIDNEGLELLVDIFQSQEVQEKRFASMAFHVLTIRTSFLRTLVPDVSLTPEMNSGEEHVNNPKLSDITFVVEGGASAATNFGRRFYAHKDRLHSSKVFQAMFKEEYCEKEAKEVVIPNIKWEVFELMMRFIYTGKVDVSLDNAQDLLIAADQYLLDDLKETCGLVIVHEEITEENVLLLYELGEKFSATTLRLGCMLFLLQNFDNLQSKPWYFSLLHRIVPDIRFFFSIVLGIKYPWTENVSFLDLYL